MASEQPKTEEVSLFGGLVSMERCSNQGETAWKLRDDRLEYAPSACRGFFGRLIGLYFDTLPQLQEAGWSQEQEDREFRRGGTHEGAQPWAESPPPPPAPAHSAPPAKFDFVSSSGRVFTKHFDYSNGPSGNGSGTSSE